MFSISPDLQGVLHAKSGEGAQIACKLEYTINQRLLEGGGGGRRIV